jgi:poly(A) polymerase
LGGDSGHYRQFRAEIERVSNSVLPDATWRHSEGLHAIVAALSEGEERPHIVGGAVRDSLLGLQVADIDLATPLLPDVVTQRLEHNGIKAVPTGIDHGTVTAVSAGQNFEITTLRRDVSTDGRRATVAFSTDWREDAARRDFTINALYADPETGEIFDYFGGLADLKAGLVRFIGDADTRIAEDHLRILRFFRFHARFGRSAPDAAALAACAKSASSLMALSRERINDELSKLLVLPDPLASVELMQQHGIFAAFLPEIIDDAAPSLARLLQREQLVKAEPKFGRRLNAILPLIADVVEKVAARLKMSNRQRQELMIRASQSLDQQGDEKALAYRVGIEIARDICLLRGSGEQWQSAYHSLDGWAIPNFPISGGQLIERGLKAGPNVAKCLQKAEAVWIEEGFPDDARVSAIADQLVADILSSRNE